jgi:hypothetical protein
MGKMPVSYSDITLEMMRSQFGIAFSERLLFPNPGRLTPTPWLQTALAMGNGMAIFSEKARNELIVSPILLTCRELAHDAFYIFSGVRFDVDGERGLKGECDFILARTPPTPLLTAPIVVIVEAKKQDIEGGWGQCAAQMLAAKLFNEREGKPVQPIFGCVTTGDAWHFLELSGNDIAVDARRYFINEVDIILWIITQICNPPDAG